MAHKDVLKRLMRKQRLYPNCKVRCSCYVGDYKKMLNEVGCMDIALPEEVADKKKAVKRRKDF